MTIKNLKLGLLSIAVACTAFLLGWATPFTAYAEEVGETTSAVETEETVDTSEGTPETDETSTETGDISSDTATSEEVADTDETSENGAITDGKTDSDTSTGTGTETDEEITITDEEIKGIIQQAYNKAKDWVKNTYAWIIGVGGGSLIVGAFAILLKIVSKKIDKSNNLTEEKVESICTKTVEKCVKNIVGKSLNVDIQAEVHEVLMPLFRDCKTMAESAKNAEVGTAQALQILSKSRLITDEETKQAVNTAQALLAHAETCGKKLSAPIQIITESKEEVKETKEVVNLVETPNKPTKKENESYITF